jgi:hypothetical protein
MFRSRSYLVVVKKCLGDFMEHHGTYIRERFLHVEPQRWMLAETIVVGANTQHLERLGVIGVIGVKIDVLTVDSS